VETPDIVLTLGLVARESHFYVPFGRNKDFVGREPILVRLLAIIPPTAEVDDCQRTAIVGLGGVGKTQIALEAAFQVRDAHPGCSIFWVPAVNVTSFENAYREIGRQIGVGGIDEDTADVKTLVREALSRESSGHWLLIVDNADDPDLLFSDIAISDFLPFSRKGSVLFTSRNREAAVRLDIPERNIVTTAEMDVAEATDLLLKGLNSQRCNLEDAKSLLDFLANLPLAIKQASAYIAKTGMSIARYLEHCKSSDKTLIKLLSKDFEDRGRYKGIQNPVATTWLISFKQISRDSPVAARYLKFICFLAEKQIPISLLPPASDQLEADEAIGILKAYAFITNREGLDSFDMHRLVRLATRNWLDNGGKHKVCVTEVIQHLIQAIPYPRSYNKHIWIKYLPHLEAALGSRDGCADKSASFLLLIAVQCYYVLGQYQTAEQKARQVLELQGKLFIKRHPQTLEIMDGIAICLSRQGKYEEAEAMFRQTMELKRKVLGEESPSTLRCIGDIGLLLDYLGKYEEAEQMSRQALDRSMKVLDQDDPGLAYSINSLAVVLSNRGKHEEAEGLCRQAMEQMRKRLSEENPHMLGCMSTLGQVLGSLGKYEEAEGILRQTMQVRERVLGKDHPDTLKSMRDLAGMLNGKGNHMEAEGLCRQALELMRNVVGEEHPDRLSSMNTLGAVLSSQGKYEEAEDMLRRTVKLREKVLGKEHPYTLSSLYGLAAALKFQGKRENAVALMEKCYQLQVQKLGPDHHMTRSSLTALNVWKLEGQ
jgi:tetratricopeptide (TPR) repeat protein